MCLILDTNLYNLFLQPDNRDMKPVKDWVDTDGKIAWSPTGKMRRELDRSPRMKKRFEEYRRDGKLKLYPPGEIEWERKRLPKLHSNDPDIIALARITGVNLLVSGDKDLHTDFKQLHGQRKIYQTRNHIDLLRNNRCP